MDDFQGKRPWQAGDASTDFYRRVAGNGGNPGGLRKIADAPRPCLSPEHNPPSMIVLEPGVYEYTCPSCGKTVTFTVAGVTL